MFQICRCSCNATASSYKDSYKISDANGRKKIGRKKRQWPPSTQTSVFFLHLIISRAKLVKHDYVQWMIDTFPKGEPYAAIKIIKQTLALWFASVHQPAMVSEYLSA